MFSCRKSDRQSTAHGPNASVQRQFPDAQRAPRILEISEIAGRSENAQCDRQIETRALFSDVGRSKIHGCFVKRKEISAVCDRRPDPFPGFADRRVRQPDNCKRRRRLIFLSNRLKVDLDIDNNSVYAVHGGRLREEKHNVSKNFGPFLRFLKFISKSEKKEN